MCECIRFWLIRFVNIPLVYEILQRPDVHVCLYAPRLPGWSVPVRRRLQVHTGYMGVRWISRLSGFLGWIPMLKLVLTRFYQFSKMPILMKSFRRSLLISSSPWREGLSDKASRGAFNERKVRWLFLKKKPLSVLLKIVLVLKVTLQRTKCRETCFQWLPRRKFSWSHAAKFYCIYK